ncbi:MAG: endonuclease/exonuclease/phosphatase family protein [Pseudomonadota bacterium]
MTSTLDSVARPLRLATYNVEWFTHLFDRNDRLKYDDKWSARYNVTRAQQADAIAQVLKAVDADLFLITEAPNDGVKSKRSTVQALTHFAGVYRLRQRAALIGFPSPTFQEIALLFDPDRIAARHDPIGEFVSAEAADRVEPFHRSDAAVWGQVFPGAPRFDGVFPWDIDKPTAGSPPQREINVFSKPPLEAIVTDIDAARSFRLIGVHMKSKNGKPKRDNEEQADDAAEDDSAALAIRRKHLGQSIWLRARIAEHLAAGDDVVALGDFNDGPGLDDFERQLGQSGLDLIIGDDADNAHRLAVAPGPARPTTRYWRQDVRAYAEAAIDHILLSAGIADCTDPEWRTWRPDDPTRRLSAELSQALETASDHFPVSVDLTWPRERR